MKSTHAWAAAGIIVVSATGLGAVASLPSVWASFRPATCMPDRCFCEAVRDQLIRQPANAISGVAFLAVAAIVLLALDVPRRNRGSVERASSSIAFPILLAFATAVIGVGTVLYHASLTFWAQTVDVLGMYLVVTALAVYRASTLIRFSRATLVGIYIGVNTVLLSGLVLLPAARRLAFAALVVLVVCVELVARQRHSTSPASRRFFFGAVLVIAAGFAIWTLDFYRVVCLPESWIQGHALWHLAGACATLLAFQGYGQVRAWHRR
jgi:hypothetical protein